MGYRRLMTLVIGVDENGLGPRLGPLIVTAVAIEADPAVAGSAKAALSKPPSGLRGRLADSKELVSYGESWLGEAWARAIAERAGLSVTSPEALLRGISLRSDRDLRAPCPPQHETQCWNTHAEAFAADDAAVARAKKDLARLERRGLNVRKVRTEILCTRRLNDAARAGTSRFAVDLHAMERLVLSLREELGRDVTAVCGKVGGYDRYGDAFGPLAGRLHVALEEGRARSEYRFPGLGTMAFVRDADESHLSVSLASLVGKWARDLLMGRIVRHYQGLAEGVPDASGYHDPVTARFVLSTALVRKDRGIDGACFEREARAGAPPVGAKRKVASRRPEKTSPS